MGVASSAVLLAADGKLGRALSGLRQGALPCGSIPVRPLELDLSEYFGEEASVTAGWPGKDMRLGSGGSSPPADPPKLVLVLGRSFRLAPGEGTKTGAGC
jgi:hypothetical protein